jgi:hypothetical protein
MLETMKELFGVTHVRDDEEEVPNVKCMCVVEEEVPVPQGPSIEVPPEEEVPLKEEVFLAPAIIVQ